MRDERLLQAFSLHDVRVKRTPVIKWVNVLGYPFRIDMNKELHAGFLRHLLSEFIHGAKLPARIHMQKRKRRRTGVKRFSRQVQHDRRVFSDRIQHHRVLSVRHDLSHDVDAFSLESV